MDNWLEENQRLCRDMKEKVQNDLNGQWLADTLELLDVTRKAAADLIRSHLRREAKGRKKSA